MMKLYDVVIAGAGPAGLEFARVAAAQGHQLVVYERERHVGGHVRAYGALPNRQQYGTIATWLAEQASGNGAAIKTDSPVTAENIDGRIWPRAAAIAERFWSPEPVLRFWGLTGMKLSTMDSGDSSLKKARTNGTGTL